MECREPERICRKCGSTRVKRWRELEESEREVASRLIGPEGRSSSEERMFCARCLEPAEDRPDASA